MKIQKHYAVEKFIDSLDVKKKARTYKTIDLLQEFGHELGMPYSRHMRDGLLELRIRGKREIRILYCFYTDSVLLLSAFIKKTQATPSKEIELARSRRP
jgi:phage-related protein